MNSSSLVLIFWAPISLLFNKVVCTGLPVSWSRHLIYPIHKTGPTSDSGNYRTIMIGHIFAKLYATAFKAMLSRAFDIKGHRARG